MIRLGFADGAYARWRSLYELCVYADFIKHQGEQIAKQYIEQSETDESNCRWAKGAVDETILDALRAKDMTQKRLIEAVKAQVKK